MKRYYQCRFEHGQSNSVAVFEDSPDKAAVQYTKDQDSLWTSNCGHPVLSEYLGVCRFRYLRVVVGIGDYSYTYNVSIDAGVMRAYIANKQRSA